MGTEGCPWKEAEDGSWHGCAIDDTSLRNYFRGIEFVDTLRCEPPQPQLGTRCLYFVDVIEMLV